MAGYQAKLFDFVQIEIKEKNMGYLDLNSLLLYLKDKEDNNKMTQEDKNLFDMLD